LTYFQDGVISILILGIDPEGSPDNAIKVIKEFEKLDETRRITIPMKYVLI
jgi:hypothetical protein